ncbi:MAG: hypothetical protein KY464_10700, partial [Gemmatimonadetes bacterium]|nr:hypothetical protein [Gemmatimonadota bacterium]
MISRLEEGTPESQAPRQSAMTSRVAWVGGWAAGIAIAFWLTQLLAIWLLVAAVGATAWSWFARNWLALATAAVLWITVGLGFATQLRVTALARDWSNLRAEIEGDAAARLNTALDEVVGRAEQAVLGASSIVRGRAVVPGSAFTRLRDVRDRTGIAAIAVLERNGRPIVWSGEHRGTIPRTLLRSAER